MRDLFIVFFASYSAWIVAAFLAIYPLFGERRKKIFIVFEALAAAILSRFVFAEIIRYFYDAQRPFENMSVKLLIPHDAGGSFPSGHATFFFAIAATFFLYNRNIGGILFAAAILMGVGRVMAYLHWPVDIMAGAAIGIISALIINYFFDKKFGARGGT